MATPSGNSQGCSVSDVEHVPVDHQAIHEDKQEIDYDFIEQPDQASVQLV